MRHWHRSSSGTSPSTCSTWAPQPFQVGRPHFPQIAALHIPPRVSEMLPLRSPNGTQGGIMGGVPDAHEGQREAPSPAPLDMSTKIAPVVEVFADIWCPFAHVGLRAIEEERARSGRSDLVIWVRAWPLELVNGAPLDPTATKEHADALREQVAPHQFAHLELAAFPSSTLGALALANRAYRTDVGIRRASQPRPAGRALRRRPGHLESGRPRVRGPRPRPRHARRRRPCRCCGRVAAGPASWRSWLPTLLLW